MAGCVSVQSVVMDQRSRFNVYVQQVPCHAIEDQFGVWLELIGIIGHKLAGELNIDGRLRIRVLLKHGTWTDAAADLCCSYKLNTGDCR